MTTMIRSRAHQLAAMRAYHWRRVQTLTFPEFIVEYQEARRAASAVIGSPEIPAPGMHQHVVHYRMLACELRKRLRGGHSA